MSTTLPHSTTYRVKSTANLTVHSFVSPGPLFANATHIIELSDQLILVDGQFFAQYGQEFRELADNLKKPISRFYITHDHPDHYLGMGDAFQDVTVYALPEIKASILKAGPIELQEKKQKMGNLIAGQLAFPTATVEPGEEVIKGVKFIFERVLDTESPSTLVIKLPELGIIIAQDILYHNAHAFITGPIDNWKKVLYQIREDEAYDLILPGHGRPAEKADIDNAINYLEKAFSIYSNTTSPEQYKHELLEAYPSYAAEKLIDIYSPILFGGQSH
ncbi:MBL fold metallo-hydrolase [Chitinophaga sancti]|uniref:MBL fold metallo-hydrolase n=1 Tax=Chitinophaga sancti TaxID=1004 RepID=UPI003F799BD7